MQADISSATTAKTGLAVFGFGTSPDGKRAVRVTSSFFIDVIDQLLVTPNLTRAVKLIRKQWSDQLEARLTERSVQLREGRHGDIESELLVNELKRICSTSLSRRLLSLLFDFWYITQGADQISRHDFGMRLRWLFVC